MRLRWTEAAVHDLTRICDYIQEHASGAVAQRVALAIYQHIVLYLIIRIAVELGAHSAPANW